MKKSIQQLQAENHQQMVDKAAAPFDKETVEAGKRVWGKVVEEDQRRGQVYEDERLRSQARQDTRR